MKENKTPSETTIREEEVRRILERMGIEDVLLNPIPKKLKQRGITPSRHILKELEKRAEEKDRHFSTSNSEADVEQNLHITLIPEEEAERIVNPLLQRYPDLEDVDDLYETVLEDIQTVRTKEEFHGTPVAEVLRSLWQKKERGGNFPPSSISSKITENTGTNTGTSQTAGALLRLSSENSKKLWTNCPIVAGNERWKLTEYGKVISYLLFETGKEVYNSDEVGPMKESEDHLGLKAGLDFETGLRELLHESVVSPATVDPEFKNPINNVLEDGGF